MRDSYRLDFRCDSQLRDDYIQKVADAEWEPMDAADYPVALSGLAGGLTVLLEASRTGPSAAITPENSAVGSAAFPAISEASGSMLGLIAVVMMLLLIGVAYAVEKVCHLRSASHPNAPVRHAPAHRPPNRASA